MHYVDCYKILTIFEATLMDELMNGKIIRMDTIGSFQLGTNVSGSDTKAAVNSKNFKAAKINFRLGKKLKEILKDLEYKKFKNFKLLK